MKRSSSTNGRLRGWTAGLVLCGLPLAASAQEPADLPPMPAPEPVTADAGAPAAPPTAATAADRGVDFAPGLIPGTTTPIPETLDAGEGPRPNVLGRPLRSTPFGLLSAAEEAAPARRSPGGLLRWPFFPTSGYAGRSSVLPSEYQADDSYIPIEDRWRVGYPFWDRYDRGNRLDDDYPYETGSLLDPFNQNVLKGDYPILGQHTFLEMTGTTNGIYEFRQLPTATTPFESTARPFENNFFGRPNQFFFVQNFILTADLSHGDAGFKPADWRIRITPVFNINNLNVNELGVVNPNTLNGTQRVRTMWTVQEWFAETKLSDVSPYYDFLSLRVGSQPFISDFRGFLFFDVNSGVRLFGNADSNRTQFNVAYFRQLEKNVNSFLNEPFQWRNQNLLFANIFRQDFLVPGYTGSMLLAYNNDNGGVKFDANHFLVRPDPVGSVRPHSVNAGYFGLGGEGHFGRYNIFHQFFWAFGRDSNNPIANRAQTINAQMFAIEGSYDRDWARFKLSFLFQSGDRNPNNTHATGWDYILNNPVFAGGQFSFYQRQFIPLFGVFLTQRNSFANNLRQAKVQSQSNFVNPGLYLGNAGVDLELTPKIKMFNNANLLWFDQTAVLEQFLYDGHIHNFIGVDLSSGFEYRPLVSENVIFLLGAATLIQGQGMRDLYNNVYNRTDPFVQVFGTLVLTY